VRLIALSMQLKHAVDQIFHRTDIPRGEIGLG